LYLGRGIQPDFVTERLPQHFAGPHRFGLASGSVQRGDLLRAQVFAERLGVHPRVDVAEDLEVAAIHQVRVVSSLDQHDAELA
jgi:hypothetical protein